MPLPQERRCHTRMPLLPALPRRTLLPTLLPAQLQKVNAALAALAGEGARSKSKTSSKRGSDNHEGEDEQDE